MEVCHDLKDIALGGRRTSVAIGNFDGLHLGHRALVERMLAQARAAGAVPAILTFFPHPAEVLRPAQPLQRLSTATEKLALLEGQGVELVLVAKFDRPLASLSPEEFFSRYLDNALGARSIHVGFDFRFGKERAGDTQALANLCRARGIHLQVESAFELDGIKVSSSAIRKLLLEGEVSRASRLLGRRYSLSGQVVAGDGRGHQIGFATANLRCPIEKVRPKSGVYVTSAIWQKQRFLSVTNIGHRPTFHAPSVESAPSSIETHLLDFNSRLYGEVVELEFRERVRDERRFDSVAALKEQIARDVALARTLGP